MIFQFLRVGRTACPVSVPQCDTDRQYFSTVMQDHPSAICDKAYDLSLIEFMNMDINIDVKFYILKLPES